MKRRTIACAICGYTETFPGEGPSITEWKCSQPTAERVLKHALSDLRLYQPVVATHE
jgi:hypothetical protein